MIQRDLYTSYDNSEFVDIVFDDEPFCKNDDDQSTTFDNELYKGVNLDDNHYHTLRSKSVSKTLHYKPRKTKFQSLNKVPELIDLPKTNTVHDSPTSFAKQSNSSRCFNQSQTSNRNTRTKHDLRLLSRKFCFASHHLPLRISNHFH